LKGALFLIAAIALAGCSQAPRKAPVEHRSAAPSRLIDHHVVSRGETLFSIAWRYGLDFRQLAAANEIDSPYTIYRGQKLVLPRPGVKLADASEGAAKKPVQGSSKAARGHRGEAASAGQTRTKRRGRNLRDDVADDNLGPWQWPANGPVVQRFGRSGTETQGIDIRGELGQPVCAANSGKVVYAGSGLSGYGNLLIIKHSDQYLSAYAHNNRLLVQEGKFIKAGDRIAEIGDSGTDSVKLHFQIRRNGEPIDPQGLLPRR
jgi:lipoprotein NlpD